MMKKLLSKFKTNEGGFKLKFSKEDNSWVVLKGHMIMFIGEQEQCKTYMSNFA